MINNLLGLGCSLYVYIYEMILKGDTDNDDLHRKDAYYKIQELDSEQEIDNHWHTVYLCEQTTVMTKQRCQQTTVAH